MLFSTLFYICSLFAATGLAGYVLEDDYFSSGNFWDQFSFFEGDDPTHGFVDYQSLDGANNAGLISSSGGLANMSVDSTNASPNGRPSVRITSNKAYSSGLVIVDIAHMPSSTCGTWPAFWMVGPNWPNGGEIDIIEGVNGQTANDVTLHTGPGCSVENTGDFSGSLKSGTCESSNGNNNGCQIQSSDTTSYGTGFNQNGGVYAMEWTSSYISVHYFSSNSIPSDISSGSPDPSSWGTPMAKFSGDCDMSTAFVDQQIVFDTTFCGDWAGADWDNSCAASTGQTCEDYVANHPEAFADSYWSIRSLKVFQNSGDSAAMESPSASTSTSAQYAAQPTPVAPTTTAAAAATTFVVATSSAAPFVPVVDPSGVVGAGGSPAETGTGYAPVIGGNGVVGNGAWSAPAPAETAAAAPAEQGDWSTAADGSLVYAGDRRDALEDGLQLRQARHARHLRYHKAHGRRF